MNRPEVSNHRQLLIPGATEADHTNRSTNQKETEWSLKEDFWFIMYYMCTASTKLFLNPWTTSMSPQCNMIISSSLFFDINFWDRVMLTLNVHLPAPQFVWTGAKPKSYCWCHISALAAIKNIISHKPMSVTSVDILYGNGQDGLDAVNIQLKGFKTSWEKSLAPVDVMEKRQMIGVLPRY